MIDACMYLLMLMSKKCKVNIASVVRAKYINRIDGSINCIFTVNTSITTTEPTNPANVAIAAPFIPYIGMKK